MGQNQNSVVWRWRMAAVVCALICGCNRWRLPAELPGVLAPAPATPAARAPASEKSEASATVKLRPRPAQAYDWHEVKSPTDDSPLAWRNDLLDGLSHEPGGMEELRKLAQSDAPEAAASASIQLARLEEGSRDLELERIALTDSHTIPTRLAAIETLGTSPSADARQRLLRIASASERAIHSGIGLTGEPIPEDRFLAAVIMGLGKGDGDIKELSKYFAQNAPQMACAAFIKLHQRKGEPHLPSQAIACFDHPSIVVRTALLDWVSTSRDEEAVDEVLKITRGGDADVLFTAIRTLGFLRGAKSTARLEELSRDRNPRIVGAALAALIHQDSQPAMTAALSETRWQVKRGVAEFLVEPATPAQWGFLESFLLDRTTAALQILDRTITTWPADARQRCALVGLTSEVLIVRQNSWYMLEALYPREFEFLPAADEPKRAAQLAEIRAKLGAPIASRTAKVAETAPPLDQLRELIRLSQGDDKSRRQVAELTLIGLGNGLPRALDSLSQEELRSLDPKFWTQIAAAADPRFAAAGGLKSPDVAERRKAAQKLMDQSAGASPPICLLIWLDHLIAIEEDPLVWRKVLSLASRANGDGRNPAASIALNALQIETLDVRVSACGILEKAPERAEYVPALEPLLNSESQVEQIAAIKALGQQTTLPTVTLERLATLLSEPRGEPRIEAALVLAKQGDRRGVEVLRTAALTGPETERRLAVARLGDATDESHLPLLMALLDASPTLRQAALESLDNLVAEEVIAHAEKQSLSSTESASRWKAWYSARKPR
jgi:HEAT repeat protein